jgi:hypothetical protein
MNSPASRPFASLAVRVLTLCGLALAAGAASAQGGPPMVTDDPGTPGDGHWEVNVGAIAAHTSGRWEIAAPDADVNYGWGEHVQLKLELPWVTTRDDGGPWKSGVGNGGFGVKWRFLDSDSWGFSMSTYPQVTSRLLESSVRRGMADAGHQFFLPVELATEVGGVGVVAEVGHHFANDQPSDWVAGLVAGHSCGTGVECMVEARATQASGQTRTLLNFGLHWTLDESLALLAAGGREFGGRADERQQALFYLGVQISR